MPYTAFWGRSAGQMNGTRIWFAGYINEGTTAGIIALRRLKIKRCGELALRLSSRLTFAGGYVAARAIHLTGNPPLQICVAVPRLAGDAKTRGPARHTRPTGICGGATAVRLIARAAMPNCLACYGRDR